MLSFREFNKVLCTCIINHIVLYNKSYHDVITKVQRYICEHRMKELEINKINYEIFFCKMSTSILLMGSDRKMNVVLKQIDELLSNKFSFPRLCHLAIYNILKTEAIGSWKFIYDEIIQSILKTKFLETSSTSYLILAFNEVHKFKTLKGVWWLSYEDWYHITSKMISSFAIDIIKYLNSREFAIDLKTIETIFQFEIIRKKTFINYMEAATVL